jgi:hypothetical protein
MHVKKIRLNEGMRVLCSRIVVDHQLSTSWAIHYGLGKSHGSVSWETSCQVRLECEVGSGVKATTSSEGRAGSPQRDINLTPEKLN